MSESSGNSFVVTHETRLLDMQGEPLCCIIDNDQQNKPICEELVQGGYDYNLKGIILKNPDGYQLACRYIVKNDNHLLDYKIAPNNEWIAELRKSKKLAIADTVGITMMIGEDIWTGDIEEVLKIFYSNRQESDSGV